VLHVEILVYVLFGLALYCFPLNSAEAVNSDKESDYDSSEVSVDDNE
jgi:hypothetical protein